MAFLNWWDEIGKRLEPQRGEDLDEFRIRVAKRAFQAGCRESREEDLIICREDVYATNVARKIRRRFEDHLRAEADE